MLIIEDSDGDDSQSPYTTARGSRSASPVGTMERSVSHGSRVVSSIGGRGQSLPGRLPGDRAVSWDRGRAQSIRHYTPEPRTTPTIGLQDPAI